MNEKSHLSPVIFLFTALFALICYFLVLQHLVSSTPLLLLVFLKLFFSSAIDDNLWKKSKFQLWSAEKLGMHLLLGFIYLGFTLCFLKAFCGLPLMTVAAISLSYPIFVPLLLRLLFGKRVFFKQSFGLLVIGVGLLMTFNVQHGSLNLLVVLALFASILKALYQCIKMRLMHNHHPRFVWLAKSVVSIGAAFFLLAPSWPSISYQLLLLVLIAALLEKLSQKSLRHCFDRMDPLTVRLATNSLILILGGFDYLNHSSLMSLRSLLCAALIYCGLFFVFFQKKLLPNSIDVI